MTLPCSLCCTSLIGKSWFNRGSIDGEGSTRTSVEVWREGCGDEAVGVVNRWKSAPFDDERLDRLLDVDSFGGIN